MSTPVPAFPPPVDPDNLGRGPLIMGLTWTFTALAMVTVALRFHVRSRLRRSSFAWDDWLMLAAMIFQVVGQCLLTVSYHYGLGKQQRNLHLPDEMVTMLKWCWIGIGPGQATSALARISITISLVFLFGVHKWFKWFLIILTTLQTVIGVAMIPITYTQVIPIDGLWNVFRLDVQHRDPRIFIYGGYVGQCLFTFCDLTYVLFPVIIIWRLQMPMHRRIGLIVLMAASLFTMSMSIMKLVTLHWQGDSQSPDVLDNAALVVFWAGMEQTCVIIMGCVPSLRGLKELDLLGLGAIGASLSSLMGTRSQKSRTSGERNRDTGLSSGQPYHDLEICNHKGHLFETKGNAMGNTVTFTAYPHKESNESLVEANYIRFTNQWSILYDESTKTANNTG
ncbi:hypothetical protein HIM_08873 [Hirsutella minnesotensis 3608]|uniref:Rhodopsin domain-containing protein n=1 Tax=Hirsutella minnesotensis 3608 TaxID=1043627 RepID=A0A0F7ZGZ1_9HYPO|nr:hypothetical protein HIM_08873 [Hirsutella minnesotensis 3608]